jgi:hypothetical protein
MVKSAVAYRANGTVVIAPVVRTPSGLGLEVEPEGLGGKPDEDNIARALAHALAKSDRVVAHPAQAEGNGFFQPFLKATGTRSHKAFMADARRVSVRLVDDQLKLTPQRNLGAKNGFEAIPDEAELVPVNDWSTAAVTLLRLLSASDD